MSRHTLPRFFDFLGVPKIHPQLDLVHAPVLGPPEQVDFSVGSPDHGGAYLAGEFLPVGDVEWPPEPLELPKLPVLPPWRQKEEKISDGE